MEDLTHAQSTARFDTLHQTDDQRIGSNKSLSGGDVLPQMLTGNSHIDLGGALHGTLERVGGIKIFGQVYSWQVIAIAPGFVNFLGDFGSTRPHHDVTAAIG